MPIGTPLLGAWEALHISSTDAWCKLHLEKLAPPPEEPFSLQEVSPLEPTTQFPVQPQANKPGPLQTHRVISYFLRWL